jgi:integrase
MLFDWLVVGQVLPTNPASAIVGLRDRALMGVLVFSFARIGAALSMKVEDYYPQGKRWRLRLHEKGGKRHEVPCHHTLEEYLDAHMEAANLWIKRKVPTSAP